MPNVITREFKGITIRQRTTDGYLNATEMCKATGKLFADYHRLKTTQVFLEAFSFPRSHASRRNACAGMHSAASRGNDKKPQNKF
jgi:hypothetical protein